MKKTLAALVAAALHCTASAQAPVVDQQQIAHTEMQMQLLAHAQSHARLTDTQVLLTDGNPSKAKLADCQPLKGETVAILENRSNIDGIRGLDAARVIVLEGQCKAVQGWVGLPRLEKVVRLPQQ